MIEFKNLTLEDKPTIDRYFREVQPRNSECTFTNMFIWRDDRIGNRIAKAILTAADRGVKVYLSVDRYGVVLEKSEECKRSFFHKTQSLSEKPKISILKYNFSLLKMLWKTVGKRLKCYQD